MNNCETDISGDCPRYGLDFRETGERVRSCSRDVTTNRSRHRLPWKVTRSLDPVQCSRCDSHVVENYAFSGFDRPNAKRQTPTAPTAPSLVPANHSPPSVHP